MTRLTTDRLNSYLKIQLLESDALILKDTNCEWNDAGKSICVALPYAAVAVCVEARLKRAFKRFHPTLIVRIDSVELDNDFTTHRAFHQLRDSQNHWKLSSGKSTQVCDDVDYRLISKVVLTNPGHTRLFLEAHGHLIGRREGYRNAENNDHGRSRSGGC